VTLACATVLSPERFVGRRASANDRKDLVADCRSNKDRVAEVQRLSERLNEVYTNH
jgi:hypothetical protein